MATQIAYTWNPAGGQSVSQAVEYKRDIDSLYTEAVNGLAPAVSSYGINGVFEDNRVYDGRIKNVCGGGGHFYSPVLKAVNLTCVALTFTKTDKSISVKFAHHGRSVDQYRVLLYKGTQLVDAKIVNGTIPATINVFFEGLAASTTYRVGVEVYAGQLSKKDCPLENVATNVA